MHQHKGYGLILQERKGGNQSNLGDSTLHNGLISFNLVKLREPRINPSSSHSDSFDAFGDVSNELKLNRFFVSFRFGLEEN